MTRVTQIALSHATLTTKSAFYRWILWEDLASALSLLGALSSLCRELTVALGNQARFEDHPPLRRYDALVDSATIFASMGTSINFVSVVYPYTRQHKLGLPSDYCPPLTAPLATAPLTDRLREELALVETSAERLDFNVVRTLSSLNVFADFAYQFACEAYRLTPANDPRRHSVAELVSVAQNFRNNCNPF